MTGWTRPLFSILAFWLVFRLRYICIIIHWEQHGIWRTGMISMNRRLKSAMRRFVCFMKGFIFLFAWRVGVAITSRQEYLLVFISFFLFTFIC